MNVLRLLAAAIVALSLHCPAQQRTSGDSASAQTVGEIRGTIVVSSKPEMTANHMRSAALGRYADHGTEGAALHALSAGPITTKLSERAAVYLESDGLDQGIYRLPEKHPVLDQKNLQFHPQVLPILVGTTVDFPNRDNLFHNVFSYSEPKDFDLGRYPRDDSRSVTFDRPGVVRVYCDIHSHMNATILVLRHPYFAVPDDNGGYVIRNVPPGKYKVVLWYDREPAEHRLIDVQPGSAAVVDFSF